MIAPQKPVSLEHHLSATAVRRKESLYKLFYRYHSIPDLMDISRGLPHSSLFPVRELTSEALSADSLSSSSTENIHVSGADDDLKRAMQYGQAAGIPELREWVAKFIDDHISKPVYEGGFAQVATTGNTDGWNIVLQVLSNEWRGTDPIENREEIQLKQITMAINQTRLALYKRVCIHENNGI